MHITKLNEIETIRHSFFPTNCKILLVGESAPAAGNFFYKGDSLTNYTREAFARAFPASIIPHSYSDFLNFFRNHGFFLDDLCLHPVNDELKATRQQCNQEGIPKLAKRIKEYQPIEVICIMKAISKHVKEAFEKAQLPSSAKFHTIPFGGNGQQENFRKELATILKDLHSRGVINI